MTTRYFNVFGPRQQPGSPYSGVISLFIEALANGKPPTILGDGKQTRDFTYVADVVTGVLRACEAPNVAGEVINLAGGGRISLLELVRNLQIILQELVEPTFGPTREPATCETHRPTSTRRASSWDSTRRAVRRGTAAHGRVVPERRGGQRISRLSPRVTTQIHLR